jgi:hypothetical protein
VVAVTADIVDITVPVTLATVEEEVGAHMEVAVVAVPAMLVTAVVVDQVLFA